MKRTAMIIIAVVLCAALAFAGCSNAANMSPEPARDAYEGRADSETSFNNGKAPTDATEPGGTEGQSPFVGRMVIRNADLSVETLEFDGFVSSVLAKTNALGGYVALNSVRKRGSSSSLRYADMQLRIPAERLDEFLEAVDGLGNVTTRYENVTDITETYVDIEAHLASLRTEYATLLGLLERAETLEDIITLQDRLTSVRYQIESYEAKQRTYDSQIAFSTVNISVSEVERETVVEQETFGQETSRRFRESLEDVGEGFKNFAMWFIGNLPRICVFLFFVVAVPLTVVLIIVGSIKKKRKKENRE